MCFWQAIARGLSTDAAAAEAGVSSAVGARWFRQGGGMPAGRKVAGVARKGRWMARREHRKTGPLSSAVPRARSARIALQLDAVVVFDVSLWRFDADCSVDEFEHVLPPCGVVEGP